MMNAKGKNCLLPETTLQRAGFNGAMVLPLGRVSVGVSGLVGGKGACLSRLGPARLPVPPGFVV